MRIVDGKIRFGEVITIEMDNGKVIKRKISGSKVCPSRSTFFVNIDGKRVKVNDMERAEATLNETEQKMMNELQRVFDVLIDKDKESSCYEAYFTNSKLFAEITMNRDIIIESGRVKAVVG